MVDQCIIASLDGDGESDWVNSFPTTEKPDGAVAI